MTLQQQDCMLKSLRTFLATTLAGLLPLASGCSVTSKTQLLFAYSLLSGAL